MVYSSIQYPNLLDLKILIHKRHMNLFFWLLSFPAYTVYWIACVWVLFNLETYLVHSNQKIFKSSNILDLCGHSK
jgi:Trk-type K+ transport system membrane component